MKKKEIGLSTGINMKEEEIDIPAPLLNALDLTMDYEFEEERIKKEAMIALIAIKLLLKEPKFKRLLGLKLTWRDRLKLLKRWFKERVVM